MTRKRSASKSCLVLNKNTGVLKPRCLREQSIVIRSNCSRTQTVEQTTGITPPFNIPPDQTSACRWVRKFGSVFVWVCQDHDAAASQHRNAEGNETPFLVGESFATDRDIWNKKQCSRQLQCEVPHGIGNVINSSLFINSSLSSLSSTRHAVCRGGSGRVRGVGEEGGGRGHFIPPATYCTTTWCFALKGLRTMTANNALPLKLRL